MNELPDRVDVLARRWRSERSERQSRRRLDPADFAELRATGLLDAVVPASAGGAWLDVARSARPVCEALRHLAGADSSVALVSAMHPAVVAFWLLCPDPSQPAWEEQRRAVFESATAGEQWGTITSEPGSGGDILRTRTRATAIDAEPFLPGEMYALSGDKHFGSGSGICDRMMTTAVPDGETEPTIFVLDTRERTWDGSTGMTLLAEWDGMGMAATQSHAMRLQERPALRLAWQGSVLRVLQSASPFVSTLFTGVVLGVLDEAIAVAREQVRTRSGSLRAFEQVEWSRAELDHWLAVQAYEGALRALEAGDAEDATYASVRAKQAVAELAERTLLRITRVLGGGTFSRRSPFAHWFEDVRALGFLRPPWGLAFDGLFASSLVESREP
jgi:alkylation response protein AidB-like acyl-CoA dehydrogenase